MNVLMLFPYAPLPPPFDLGGMKRNMPFMLQLAKRNAVTVLAFGTAEEEARFSAVYGNQLAGVRFIDRKRPRVVTKILGLWYLLTGRSHWRLLYNGEMQEAIGEYAADGRADVIHACAQLYGYFRFPEGVPVVTDTHEVEYDLAERTYRNSRNMVAKIRAYLAYRMGKREEIENCGKFDALISTTERDAVIFRRDNPRLRIEVIQNGVDSRFFERLDVTREPGTLVFTGMMSFFPNDDGIRWFLEEIFPIITRSVPSAKVLVVGKDPGPEVLARASANVTVTGFVDDVRPYMARGEVFLIPLRVGGGIRGKALEAMAAGLPIVTTTIGCEGIHLRDGDSALFADTPDAFAAAVVRLLTDRSLREAVITNATRTVKELYDWNAKGEALEALYTEVIHRKHQSTSR
jgi:glycosyltransferase involved in cell wall biosynthesis